MKAITLSHPLTIPRPGPLALAVALAVALRLVNLAGPWLWYDETGSVWMASLPFEDMLAATAGDTHPPLYLALLWAWVRVAGTSPALVRLPSLVFSVLVIPVVWRVGERLNLNRPALTLAALALAVMPSQIHYGQEARMYSLFQLELWCAVWAILAGRWTAYGVALAALLTTHNYGLVYAPVLAALYWWRVGVPNDPIDFLKASTPFLWAHCLALAAFLPWLPALRDQMAMVSAGYWLQPVTSGSAAYPIYFMLWGFSPPEQIQTHAALVAFGLAAWLVVRAVRHRGPAVALVWLWVMPLALAVLASLVWRPMLLFRGVWPSSVAWALLAGWAFCSSTPARRWLAAFLVVPVAAASLTNYFLTIEDSKGGARPVAAALAGEYRPGDLVIHANEGSMMALHFYTPAGWPQYLMNGNGGNLGELTPGTRQAMGMQVYPIQDVPTWHRVLLVWAASPTVADTEDRMIAALLTKYRHVVIREYSTPLVREAVYLLWNTGVGVP